MLVNQVISHSGIGRGRSPRTRRGRTSCRRRRPDPSFPSDHAAAAFAIAFAILAFSRRAGMRFLVAATLIGLSRIALGLHYPSDVIAGRVRRLGRGACS